MQKYFDCIMDIGEQLLLSGAEVHRVEDSVERMCASVGFIRTDVFIITSSMVVTVYNDGKSYTQTRRIKQVSTDLERIHRLNDLSRKVCALDMSVEEINDEICRIKEYSSPSLFVKCLSYTVIAGSFTLFFGGNFAEAIVSALIGVILSLITCLSDKASLNKIFAKSIGAFWVTFGAYAAMKLGFIKTMDMVIIGNIMLLIPGVGLTNAIRDLLTGDSIAGLLRFIESMLFALAIAAGYFLFMFLIGGVAV